jgi:hypothetical protein
MRVGSDIGHHGLPLFLKVSQDSSETRGQNLISFADVAA